MKNFMSIRLSNVDDLNITKQVHKLMNMSLCRLDAAPKQTKNVCRAKMMFEKHAEHQVFSIQMIINRSNVTTLIR